MFSNLILRNSKRNRKDNGLFFSSLVISIIAFYIILSISNQDVMRFLQKMESDAVDKLLLMIPVFYTMTLGILFFLIYFACKYQLERRRHEFGVYLMMGMRRSKLFSMLLAEDFVSSILALLIGLPVAVLLSEMISLITAKLVGMGIIGHRFTLSLSAVVLTVIGFLVIKLMAFLILSGNISRQEIGSLLANSSRNAKRQKPGIVYGLSAVCGIAMLIIAYTMAIQGIAWQKPTMMLLTLLLGMAGTILLFYGMRSFIALLIKAGKSGGKLRIFNFRQIQENVIQQSTSLAVSSMLILAALCCFGAGIGIANTSSQSNAHTLDYTFTLSDNIVFDQKPDPAQIFLGIQTMLEDNGLTNQFSELFQIRLGHIYTTDKTENVFNMESVMESLYKLPESKDRDILLNNLSYGDYPYIICLSDYNKLLELAGKPALKLASDEAAVYRDPDSTANETRNAMLNEILAEHPQTELDSNLIYLVDKVQSVSLVTDRSITLDFALILPDEQFFYYTQGNYDVYVNGVLSEEATKGIELMNAYSIINEKLDTIHLERMDFEYESYLQNMGRQLFYMVAASYITSYLAIIFLVVSNTIMGVQFLMSQQRTGRRYQTLVRLGATYQTLCHSARKQINWFMGLPVFVAAVSSLFGVKALFAGVLSAEVQNIQGKMLVISGIIILLLCVVEYIYMAVIKRSSERYLLTLMQMQREE